MLYRLKILSKRRTSHQFYGRMRTTRSALPPQVLLQSKPRGWSKRTPDLADTTVNGTATPKKAFFQQDFYLPQQTVIPE